MRVFILWLCCLFSTGFCMLETCTRHHLDYHAGMIFTSEKDDGRRYTCTCRSSNCAQISCTLDQGPTSSPTSSESDDNDEIIGVIPIVPLPSVRTNTESDDDNFCYDHSEISPKKYKRGVYFVKQTSSQPVLICACPQFGPSTVSCREPRQCSVAATPKVVGDVTRNMPFSSCYDAWNQQTYDNGAIYMRTRFMNEGDDTITGDYSCSCNSGMMYCRARDIPCCNMATGTFADMDEKIVVNMRGEYYACTCRRGRGSFRNCRLLAGQDTSYVEPSVSAVQPIERSCRDGDVAHGIGESWIKLSRRRTFYRRCSCSQNAQIRCRNWQKRRQ